jgi:hypothetical protein
MLTWGSASQPNRLGGHPTCATRCPHRPEPRMAPRHHQVMSTSPAMMPPSEQFAQWQLRWAAQALTPNPTTTFSSDVSDAPSPVYIGGNAICVTFS